jgi:hypothetical protein
MARSIPDEVRCIQPSEPKEIGTANLRLFNLWSEEEAENYFATFELPFEEYYPVGSFICGNVLGWLTGGGVFLMDHEELQVAKSSLRFDEVIGRILSADPDIEEAVFASCRQRGPQLYATLRAQDAQSPPADWFKTMKHLMRGQSRTGSNAKK